MVARVQFNVRLPADIHELLVAIAQEEERTLNGQITYVLREWLDTQPKRRRATANGQLKPKTLAIGSQ
jgi:hypothetical protein